MLFLTKYKPKHLATFILLGTCTFSHSTAEAGWLDSIFGGKDNSSKIQAAHNPIAQNTSVPDTQRDKILEQADKEISNEHTELTTVDPDLNVTDIPVDAPYLSNNATDTDAPYLPDVVEESDLNEIPSGDLDLNQLADKGDLWDRLRKGFKLPTDIDNDRITLQRNWYLKNASYLERVAIRANRYLYHTVGEAEKRQIPLELALLPVIESAYDPFAYSHANAAGIWQFIPGTGKLMGLKINQWYDGRRDTIESTRAAYDFLQMLYSKFGDWQLALAAYNSGPGTVQRAIKRNLEAGLPTDFWSLKLPAETRDYVPRFIAITQIINNPKNYAVNLRPVINQSFFKVIDVKGQVDMVAAANIAGVSLKEFYQLNAGFKQQATDPEGPYRLLVPNDLPIDFAEQLSQLPKPSLTHSATHIVKKGENIFRIAKQYGISVNQIKEQNDLDSASVRKGQELTITKGSISSQYIALNKELHLNRIAAFHHKSKKITLRARKGDTVNAIAKRYGVSPRTLARWNNINIKTKLKTGQTLTVHLSTKQGKKGKKGKYAGKHGKKTSAAHSRKKSSRRH
jgi:membrane-bound lytic murein transglycosylase D